VSDHEARPGEVGPSVAGRPWLLVIDTATSRIVVAAGDREGRLIHTLDWPAGHRHGERLLPGLEELLAVTGLSRADLAGIIVGTGPGAFTGLRVGLATAKTLAHASGLPIVGVGTGVALLAAARTAARTAGGEAVTGISPGADGAAARGAGDDLVLLLPAGPHDRVEVREGAEPRLLPGGTDSATPPEHLVAVDLEGRAPEAAGERGAAALAGLAAALLEIGASRLRQGGTDDAERLVPEYVTLPRGVRVASGEIEWSHGPR
jgi:tRNA threonylcarbamoyladenosine biosynthesis protein TsaB